MMASLIKKVIRGKAYYLFHVKITEQHGLPALSYRFNHHAWNRLQNTLLGKNILFTDNDDWTDAQIVRACRSQHHE